MKNIFTQLNNLKVNQTSNTIFLKIGLICLLLLVNLTHAQTVLIDPSGEGGFENGTSFAANGWTATIGTSTQNQWVCNTGATAGFSGARSAYIINNTSGTPPHNYTLTATRRTHLFRDITIPINESDITLSFSWIGIGQGTSDRLNVWLTPTSYNTG